MSNVSWFLFWGNCANSRFKYVSVVFISRQKVICFCHVVSSGENTYKCISCSFSTMTISQLKEHSLQEHGETLTLPRLRAGATLRTTRPNTSPHTETQEAQLNADTNGKNLSFVDLLGHLDIGLWGPALVSSCVSAEAQFFSAFSQHFSTISVLDFTEKGYLLTVKV